MQPDPINTPLAHGPSEPTCLRESLLLRREDTALAMSEAKRNPWLCSGFEGALLPIMHELPPSWIPHQGERMPSATGSLLVLRRELVQPQTSWPWLLCALEQSSADSMNERPSASGPMAHFARRAFVYCALLCWRAGRSRSTVDENGSALRLITARDLARAAMAMTPASPARPAAKLGSFRASRPDAGSPPHSGVTAPKTEASERA